MNRRIAIAMLVTLTFTLGGVGCNKKTAKSTAPDSSPPPSAEPDPAPAPAPNQAPGSTPSPVSNPVSSFGGTTAPNQQGNLSVTGGQGAIQAPRMAAARTVNEAQLRDLHLSMFQAWQLDNRVPGADEIMQAARQNPQLMPLLKEEVVILTGTNRGDGVWAYTQYPQRAGEHKVITQQGVVPMAPDELRKRLEQQQSPAKLGK